MSLQLFGPQILFVWCCGCGVGPFPRPTWHLPSALNHLLSTLSIFTVWTQLLNSSLIKKLFQNGYSVIHLLQWAFQNMFQNGYSGTPILGEKSKTVLQDGYSETCFGIYKFIMKYPFCNTLVNLDCVMGYLFHKQKAKKFCITKQVFCNTFLEHRKPTPGTHSAKAKHPPKSNTTTNQSIFNQNKQPSLTFVGVLPRG